MASTEDAAPVPHGAWPDTHEILDAGNRKDVVWYESELETVPPGDAAAAGGVQRCGAGPSASVPARVCEFEHAGVCLRFERSCMCTGMERQKTQMLMGQPMAETARQAVGRVSVAVHRTV